MALGVCDSGGRVPSGAVSAMTTFACGQDLEPNSLSLTGDKVDYDIGLSYRPRLHRLAWRASKKTICHSRLYPPVRDNEFGYRSCLDVQMMIFQIYVYLKGVHLPNVMPQSTLIRSFINVSTTLCVDLVRNQFFADYHWSENQLVG